MDWAAKLQPWSALPGIWHQYFDEHWFAVGEKLAHCHLELAQVDNTLRTDAIGCANGLELRGVTIPEG
ncbi:hypothetical protein D3C86_2011290 [compost metagenome]